MVNYRFGLKDTVHLAFIGSALVMIYLLVGRYYFRGGPGGLDLSSEILGEVQSEDTWYGIYFQGKKIGYAHTIFASQDTLLICTDRTYMSFNMLGRTQAVDSYVRVVADRKLRIESFVFTVSSEDTDYGIRGRVDGDRLNLNITTAGQSRGETIRIKEPPQLPSTVSLLLARQKLEPGLKLNTTVFDPASLANVPLLAEVTGRENIEHDRKSVAVWHIHQSLSGMSIDTYMDDEGRVLVEQSQMGYRMVLEGEQTARSGNLGEAPDIHQSLAVVPDRPIPDARNLTWLKARLSGVALQDTFGLRGGCQRYEDQVLEVFSCMPSPGRAADTVPSVIREVYTSPTPFIQSEHPRLVALAARIVDRQQPPVQSIRAIMDWMQENIEKKPTFSIPNTLEVLDRRSGDCNEFAVLFCSLARAVGIPTRLALGLVYLEGAFYYHAWCECYLGEWVGVDPVFGQFPVDATHLRILAGDMDRQVEILPLVGVLGISVLDYRAGTGAEP